MRKNLVFVLLSLVLVSCSHQAIKEAGEKLTKKIETKQEQEIEVKPFAYFQDLISLATRVYKAESKDGEYYHLALDYQKILTSNTIKDLLSKQTLQLKEMIIPVEQKEKLAFLINAYNFFYIKEVISAFPVEDAKDIRKSKEIYNIGGVKYSLKLLELMLVNDFQDPRVRFGMACPAMSCPSLNPELYDTENVYIQLNNAARNYFKNPKNIKVAKKTFGDDYIATSKFFDFYEDEFESIIEFIHNYAPSRYRDYNKEKQKLGFNWDLNSPSNFN